MTIFRGDVPLEEINSWLPILDRSFGLTVTEVDVNTLKAEFTVGEVLLQRHGIMHGGVCCMVAESLGSAAGSLCLKDRNKIVVGQSLHAVFLRPARQGDRIEVTADARHLGSKSQVWEVILRDLETGKVVSEVTLTLAVIDIKELDRLPKVDEQTLP